MSKFEKEAKGDLSLKDIILKAGAIITFVKKKWLIILIWSVIGAAAGLGYALFKKTLYTATCSFVLEETKGSGLSQYAGLTSIAGINLGSDESGIFAGDNIIELYKSRIMIGKTLLSPVNNKTGGELVMDRYINFLKLRERWKDVDHIAAIDFHTPYDSLNRMQDSLLTSIVMAINKKVLTVDRPDKKLSIINVNVLFGDEVFAKEFNDKLVATVNDFYIKTKTKKTSQNVQVLQKQADSVRVVLNNSISGVASALDAAPNANPLLLTLRVPSQKKQIDVQSSSTIYAEIVKNLELSKITLRQETPLIQVIDRPVLPLPADKASKAEFMVLGLVLFAFLTTVYLILKKAFENIMADTNQA